MSNASVYMSTTHTCRLTTKKNFEPTIVNFWLANTFNSTDVYQNTKNATQNSTEKVIMKKLVVLWHKMKAIWLFLAASGYNLRFIRINERGMWFGPFMVMLNFGQWFLYVSGIVCDHFWALEVTTACVWWMTSYLKNKFIIYPYGEKIALKPRVAPFYSPIYSFENSSQVHVLPKEGVTWKWTARTRL